MYLITYFSFILALLATQHGIVTYWSFSIDNKEVVWSQVYEENETSSEGNKKDVFRYLTNKPWVSNLRYEGEDLVADLTNYKIDYKRYGAKFMKTSTILRTGRWTGRILVSFKENKYRVVVYGMNYVGWQPATGSGRVTLEAHEIDGTLSEWVLNDLRTSFRKSRLSNLDIMHYSLKENFTLVPDKKPGGDW